MNINKKLAEVVYIRKDQLNKARASPFLCEVGPNERADKEPIYTAEQLQQAQREAVAAAVSERGPILYTAIDALNKVKAWRDCDGNGGFPHAVREQIDAVLMAFETRQKENPPPPPEQP